MSLIDLARISDVVKTGAGYYYIYETMKDYERKVSSYAAPVFEVNGIRIGYSEIYGNLNQLQNLQKYQALFRDAYDNGGKVHFYAVDYQGKWYESSKLENQVVSFPALAFGQAGTFATTPAQITSAPATTSASKFIFTFQGATGNATGSIAYEVGASLTKEVTKGISKTVGQSTEQQYSIGLSASAFGAELTGNAQFTKAWSESQTIDFSTMNSLTTNSNVTLSANIDFNGLTQNADGTFQLGNSKLIVGQRYVVEVKISQDNVTAYLQGKAPIIGPNIGWHNQWAPGSVTVEKALAAGAAITGQDFSNGIPLEAKTVGKISITGEVAPPTPARSLTDANNSSQAFASLASSSDQPDINILSYTDAADVTISSGNHASLQIDMSNLSAQRAGIGTYLDLTNEGQFGDNSIEILGNIEENHVLLGDLDYTLISFQNSLIESGNGFNRVIIKDQDVGNTYKLGGGGDTIDISGSHNIIDAGGGANSIIVKGSGFNTLISGPGSDIIKLTSKTAYLNVTDWDPSQDKIEIGRELIGEQVTIAYNPEAFAYIVSVDDTVIASLYLQDNTVPQIDNMGYYQGTKIIPIDIKADKIIFINEVYTQALNRAPEKAMINALYDALDNSLSRPEFIEMVYTSKEFTNQHEDNMAFVNALYVELLGRLPDEIGQQAFVQTLNAGGSRADVVETFLHSTEFIQLIGVAHQDI